MKADGGGDGCGSCEAELLDRVPKLLKIEPKFWPNCTPFLSAKDAVKPADAMAFATVVTARGVITALQPHPNLT